MTTRALQTLWRLPEIRFAALVALLLTWCAALLACRVLWTFTFDYTFLVWNLALAAMPLIFSSVFARAQYRAVLFTAFTLWLLFFPNAPYLITDFLHLRNFTSAPIWFDILLLFSSAGAGLAIAYISLSQIHDRLLALNRPTLAWSIAILAPFAAAFGIYLGRFLRWRSIDIFQNPRGLLTDIAHRFIVPWDHPRAWGVTLGFGGLLVLGYLLTRLCTRSIPPT
jgi:uncharacterized membrane protein